MPKPGSRSRSLLTSVREWFDGASTPGRSQLPRKRRFGGCEPLERRELLTLTTTGPDDLVNNVVNKQQQTFIETTLGDPNTGNNANQAVVTNSSGRSVIVWSSFGQDRLDPQSWGVYALVYNDNLGSPVPTRLQVNTTTLGDQQMPSVAMDSKGNFVVTWQSSNQDDPGANNFGIFAQRFDTFGRPLGNEFLVNTETSDNQTLPRIAMVDDPTPDSTTDGDFIITWTSTDQDGDAGGVFFQRYDKNGVRQGDETLANQTTDDDQSFSSITAHTDGSFVITWSSFTTATNYDILARLFDADGQELDDEFRVNSGTVGNQTNSDVDMDADGNFIVTWTSANVANTTVDVFYKRYDSTGGLVDGATDRRANSFTDQDQRNSTVALDAQGNFVISWSSNLQDGSGWGVYARSFNFNDTPIGNEFKVNAFVTGDQRFSTVSSDDAGGVRITWSSFNQGGTDRSWDVYQRVYQEVRPTANDDEATTTKNTPVTIPVLTNDRPAAGTTLDVTKVQINTPPSSGTAVPNANGTITFTPQIDFTGTVTFTYVVADNTGTFSEPATVTVTVTGLGPLVVDDTATTDEDVPVDIDVLANDTPRDAPIAPGTVTIVRQPANGTAVPNPVTGIVKYTPAKDYNGTDSFTYTVRDTNNQLSAVATVRITINPIPDPPTANNDDASTNKGVPVIIDILANDTDPENDIAPGSVAIVTPPANGTTTLNLVTGAVTYTPNAGFSGVDTFQYTVSDTGGLVSNVATVTIVVNDPPVAVNDTATTPEDIPVTINILANDTDSDGTINPASVVIVTQPLNGSLFLNPTTGVVTYAPNANYNGPDSFTYTVNDNRGAVSNIATVSITILSVNDRPVANDDFGTTGINAPVTINVLANDTDVDGTLVPSSVTIVSGPTHGTATINPATGAITYTPNPGFAGGDLIIYTVKDNEGGVSNQANVTIRVGLPATIAGKVYLDSNNNGIQNLGEAGLAGVSLTLLKTDAPITFVRNTVTGADGSYSFTDLIPGTYTLVQTQPGVFLDGKETPSPGVPVGAITNDQFKDIQLGSGVNATGFNFGERGLRAEFLASYQGAQIFLASSTGGTLNIFAEPAAGLTLAAGDIWISLDAGFSGPLTFQATPSGGTAGLTIYDNNLNPLASAVPTAGTANLNYQGTTGKPYFLKVSGTSASVDVSAFDPTPAPVNVAPVLPPVGNQSVPAGQTISFIARATDANAGDKLTYDLAGNIPAGASIDPVTGLFTWKTPSSFKDPVSFTILVQDNGSTVKSDFETFQISASPATSTPTITAAEANSFVRSLYVDLLSRNADSGGLSQHTQRLLAGTSQREIVATFLNSTEYLGRVVDGMYSKYLRRAADSAGRASWIATLSGGTSATDVAIAFLNSAEYASRHLSNASFVDGLYRDVLGRAPDTGGLSGNIATLQSGGSRAALAKFFLTSGERIDQAIAEQYGKLLGRAVDPTGKASFRASLAGSMDAADDLAIALVSSPEYLAKAIRKFR